MKRDWTLDTLFAEFEDPVETVETDARKLTIRDRMKLHRAASEEKLEAVLPRVPRRGETYFVLTGGDVDSFSFLKWIFRFQKVKTMMCSTWCIAEADIAEFQRQMKIGNLGRLDFYCGEILPNSFPMEYALLEEVVESCGGRLAVFRNHSKVMAGFGNKMDFTIFSSANVNTNPRNENTVVNFSPQLAKWVLTYYDGITTSDKSWRARNRARRLFPPEPEKEEAGH